jgi:hypothetical protein
MKWRLKPLQKEVFLAAAEMAGLETELGKILDYGKGRSSDKRARKAGNIVRFTGGIVCEGRPIPENFVTKATKAIIGFTFDQSYIPLILKDWQIMVEKDFNRHPQDVTEEHRYFQPRLLTIDSLIDPSSHLLIQLGNYANEVPSIDTIAPQERLQRILELHPAYGHAHTLLD